MASKNILVLGGSRGIGAAIVRRLAADGSRVAFTYHGAKDKAEALATEVGGEAVKADSADRNAVAEVINARGKLDIVVINAGVYVGGDPLTIDPAEVDRLIDINIRGPYHAAVEAARTMNDNGRIIIIGSVNGDRSPQAGSAAYSMSKSAMQGLTRGLARDLGPRGITVNDVQPGPVDTEMNPADGPKRDVMHATMAIKRHATGAEVAALVAYLASPEAGMVTGAMHTIDGGMAA